MLVNKLNKRSYFRVLWASVLCGMLTAGSPCGAYQLAQRWTNTASGTSGLQGSPLHLTWSLVPDQTPIPNFGESNLISVLDAQFGSSPGGNDLTQRPWFLTIESNFARWSQLAGITYTYEPHDDGLSQGEFPGVLGVRGDIRLAGTTIDGSGGVLAYNFRPNGGDMVLDSSELAVIANPADDYRALRNIMMHEHGHGLGLLHVDSSDSTFLMEPTFNLTFDGPQLDDIRGIHRAYGDVLEKSSSGQGNDSAAFAFDLGVLSGSEPLRRGSDGGPDTVVLRSDSDFLSIDDELDTDFLAFTINAPAIVDVSLVPLGPTYSQGPRGGPQSVIDSSAVSDLAMALFAPDGTTLLRAVNATGAGGSESLLGWNLTSSGRYFVRITGNANDVQLYRLGITATLVPEPAVTALVLLLLVPTWRCLERRTSLRDRRHSNVFCCSQVGRPRVRHFYLEMASARLPLPESR